MANSCRPAGRVVKNVTGYDLMRLWMRLTRHARHPHFGFAARPPIRETVDIAVRNLSRAEALKMANAAYLADCRPDIADIIRERRSLDTPPAGTCVARGPRPNSGAGNVAAEFDGLYRVARDPGFEPGHELTIRIACPRTQLDDVSGAVEVLAPSATVLRPLGGGMTAAWTADEAPPVHRAQPVFEAIRSSLKASGGSLIVERMPLSWRPGIDPWGEPPGSFVIMQRLKAAYDARGRLNSGRFCGGI